MKIYIGTSQWLRALLMLIFVTILFIGSPAASQNVFTVTNTADSGPGSMRQAIIDANSTANVDASMPDWIKFDIPGSWPHTIQPGSALPTITDPVIIDGYTQSGACPNTNGPGLGSDAVLKIELDGSNAGASANGLRIWGGNSTVRGLVINRFGSPEISEELEGILAELSGSEE